ncbi:MAG: hypothetical protein QOG48_2097, partial [Verrucomicrobiota bacterium]|jgi:hypothetical protein
MTFGIGGQRGDRRLGDFIQLRIGSLGEAQISYADSNNLVANEVAHAMYVRQNGGNGLYAATSPVNIPGIAPFNSVSDETADARYEANGTISATMPNLDILGSSVRKLTTAPCSTSAPCYQVVMQLNNLSLIPDVANDPDPDLVWLTQWMVPSTTDPNGGKDFFVYAESTGGGAMQCFAGESHAMRDGDWFVFTYPGNGPALPAANCVIVPGPNGTITIDVPLSLVNEANPIDDKLHEVTASTMTLAAPANSEPNVGTYQGLQFNIIDVAQPYVFNPSQLVRVVSRKMHGSAGTFDVDLPLTGTAGIECRSGGDYDIVFAFTGAPATGVATCNGNAATATSSGNETTVHCSGLANAQHVSITLNSISVPMDLLIADTTADRSVNSADIAQTKSKSGQTVDASNFRQDVTVDGSLNSADIALVKSKSGTALP